MAPAQVQVPYPPNPTPPPQPKHPHTLTGGGVGGQRHDLHAGWLHAVLGQQRVAQLTQKGPAGVQGTWVRLGLRAARGPSGKGLPMCGSSAETRRRHQGRASALCADRARSVKREGRTPAARVTPRASRMRASAGWGASPCRPPGCRPRHWHASPGPPGCRPTPALAGTQRRMQDWEAHARDCASTGATGGHTADTTGPGAAA